MSYSFDFGAEVTRICMNEIRRRGLDERKILRKSAPNSILLLKVFRQQNCTADDLIPVSIHSVATLMQDTLWCCQERIVPKKVWKIINYETCTLPNLSKVLTKKGEALLIEILDFLVELMQHKTNNLMDAYHLGEAMGKVTLGPADCDPIIAEKAGHFMTRMIIEHSKWMTQTKRPRPNHLRLSAPPALPSSTAAAILPPSPSSSTAPSSPSSSSSSYSSTSASSTSTSSLHLLPTSFATYQEGLLKPMSKTEAAKAKAKSYNRLIQRIKNFNVDWVDYANVGLRALMDDDYELEPLPKDEPWISIFAPQLDPKDANASPLLYRIISQATLEEPPVPSDPFASSYWFQNRHSHPVLQTNETGGPAFSEFAPLIQSLKNSQQQHQHANGIDGHPNSAQWQEKEKPSKSQLKKINHSLANIKVNLRKRQPTMDDNSGFVASDFSTTTEIDSGIQHHHEHQQHVQLLEKQLPPSPQELDQPEELPQQHEQQHKKLPSLSLVQNQPPSPPPHQQKQQEQPSNNNNNQQQHQSNKSQQQVRQAPQVSTNSMQRQHEDNYSTKDQHSILNVSSKHNQVKNLMRRMIKIGNTNSGSSIKKSHSHIVY